MYSSQVFLSSASVRAVFEAVSDSLLQTLVNESTKFTPFEVDTGRKVRNLIVQEFGVEDGVIEQVDVADFAKNLAVKRQQIIKLAQENLKQAQERQKKYYDRKHRDVEFEAGNLVMLDTKNLPLKTVARSTSLQKAKLAAKKVGPFKIDAMVNKNVARLVLPPNMKRLHPAFNVELLSHYVENPTKFYTRPIPKATPVILDDETGEALHVVEVLLRRKVHNRQSMWLVKWLGYPAHEIATSSSESTPTFSDFRPIKFRLSDFQPIIVQEDPKSLHDPSLKSGKRVSEGGGSRECGVDEGKRATNDEVPRRQARYEIDRFVEFFMLTRCHLCFPPAQPANLVAENGSQLMKRSRWDRLVVVLDVVSIGPVRVDQQQEQNRLPDRSHGESRQIKEFTDSFVSFELHYRGSFVSEFGRRPDATGDSPTPKLRKVLISLRADALQAELAKLRAELAPSASEICRYYNDKGWRKRGDACKWIHYDDSEVLKEKLKAKDKKIEAMKWFSKRRSEMKSDVEKVGTEGTVEEEASRVCIGLLGVHVRFDVGHVGGRVALVPVQSPRSRRLARLGETHLFGFAEGGGTWYSAGLNAANGVLSRNDFKTYRPIVVFFSDGQPEDQGPGEQLTISLRQSCGESGREAFAVGFGSINLQVLQRVAEMLGGTYHHALTCTE
ncbi:hypothetical protein FI667_g16803, partial [Globisporangium splendens]